MWLVPKKVEQKHAISKEKELDRKLASFISEGTRMQFARRQSTWETAPFLVLELACRIFFWIDRPPSYRQKLSHFLIIMTTWLVFYCNFFFSDLLGGKEDDADFRSDEEMYFPIRDVGFDPDKCYNCTIENNHTIIHSNNGGRGYALGNVGFRQGNPIVDIMRSRKTIGNGIF